MERVEEWERELEEAAADLIQRTRRGKLGKNVEAGVEAAVETDRSVYFDEDEGMWKCHHCLWTFRMGSPGMDHVHNHKEHFRGARAYASNFVGTESNNENVGMEVEIDILTADEKNQVGKGADFKTKNIRATNDSSNVDVSSSTDVEVESQLSSSITFTETNFSMGIESTIENVRMMMDGPNAGREHTKNDETNFATKDVEIIDGLLNLDDDKGPMNLKVQSHLSSKFTYSKGHGEHGTMKFNADKDAVEAHKYGRLAHGGKPEVVEIDVERVLEEQDTHDLFCPYCHSCITKRVILRKRKRMVQDIQYDTKRGKPVSEFNLNPNLNVPTATNVTNQDREPEVFGCLSCFSLFFQTASGLKIIGFFRKSNDGEDLQSIRQIPPNNLSWISSFFDSFTGRKTRDKPEDSLPPVEENTDEELMNPPPPVDQVMQNDQDKLASPKSETPVDAGIQNGIGVPTEDPMPKPEQEETLAPDEVQLDISKLKPAAEETQPEDDAIQPAEEGSSTPAEGLPSQSNQNAPSSTEPVVSKDSDTKINIGQAKVDKTTTYNWDILKSIVYGGLVESLTSLGVVSSAAASNASTLNIVALGLANLIGGLFVLAHNLKELKNEQYSASSDDSEETVDRYKETLGQREHFKRHVFFAVLSYIIFGLIPPVVYGFSFMESGNKYFKLLAVAAASIVCITVLAIGKAYVQTPSKKYVKTVLYYLVMGVLASGLSYVVGQLLQMLLDKLGLFNSSTATLTSTFLEMRPVEAGWASF